MTHKIDKFLATHGFDIEDLKSIENRVFLYLSIFIAALIAITFAGLAIEAWT